MKKAIEWNDLSRYRGELMGIAMLFIILFHVYLPRQHAFFGLHRLGNVGVDIFFFLSGIGLWYSWTKPLEKGMPLRKALASPLISFYKKRYWRIYPAWLVMASLYYIPIYCKSKTQTLIDLIGDISINWDFWIRDELTFWYIPATMMLYMIAPFYMELIRRHPVYI
jgi:peptidoglycan/LPS O-acetylase OafA/YrhL